jgi:hypothetical protein
MDPVSYRDFDVLDQLYSARDAFFAYLVDVATDPMASFITHPVPTFMAFALAGFVVISRNGPAR